MIPSITCWPAAWANMTAPSMIVLGKLLGLRFDHHDGVVGAGDDEVELAFLDLVLGRVEDIFAVGIADAGGGDRAHERDSGEGESGGSGDHRDDVGLVLAVIGQDLGDHEDLVVEALGEERADRPVDEAAGESLLLGGAALALEKAARDAPGGREFFLIVDGEREEILPRLHVLGGGDRAKDDGLAEGRQHGAVGLTGNPARFEGERLAAQLDFYFLHVEHLFSFERPRPDAGGGLWVAAKAMALVETRARADRPALSDRFGPSRAPPDCGRPICEAAPSGPLRLLFAKTELRDECGVALGIFPCG